MSATPVGYHLMLRLRGPKGLDRIEDLIREEYVLGRGDPARSMDFAIPEDEYLSRVHLRLIRAGETYAVENLSPNGTRLNGKPLTKPTPLKHKDFIEAGTDTSLEFLAMTDQERGEALKGAAPAGDKPVEKVKKSKQPLFLAMIGFYALILLVVLMASNTSEPPGIPDPGPGVDLQGERTSDGVLKNLDGGFLQWMTRMPLQPRATEDQWRDVVERGWWTADEKKRFSPELRARIADKAKEDAGLRARRVLAENDRVTEADRIWTLTKARYGSASGSGASEYYLVQGAIESLAVRGRDNLKTAAEAGDPPAVAAVAALGRLDERLTSYKTDARRYAASRLRKPERERYFQIIAAVPDVYQPIRQWAEWRLSPGAGTR
jgi:pSer/pThr/pTyr-binding forkhead associated (FHA) protein